MNICGSYQIIVKPQYFKKLHRHVSELTGITQEQMDMGTPLPEAAERFKKWCGKDFCFLTWGPDDIPMLKENFNVHGIQSDWLDKVYDLQVIFNRQTDDSSKQRSLEYAMDYFDLEQHLPAHDALNDAIKFWCHYQGAFRVLAAEKGITLSGEEQAELLREAEADAGTNGLPAAYRYFRKEGSSLNAAMRSHYIDWDFQQGYNGKVGEACYHRDLEACAERMIQSTVPTEALTSMDLSAVYSRLKNSPFIDWRF
jgi:hypothetical protein